MSLSIVQSTILNILSDFLNGRKTIIDAGLNINYEALASFAKSQEIEGIVYYQLFKSPNSDAKKQGCDAEKLPSSPNCDPAVLSSLQAKYAYTLYSYTNRMAVLQKIDSALSDAQVPFFIFKGSEIAKFYPVPALRTMGDSDIMVHARDRQKVHEIFEALGLVRTESGPNEWIYGYKGLEFELHIRLMNEGEAGNLDSHKAFMQRHWDYTKREPNAFRCHLDDSYHFVYLILHLRKHFINSGVGFRQFSDLAVMVKKCVLNWDFIEDELSKMELLGFAKIVLSLCEHWFGISSPLKTDLKSEFAETAADQIFKGGVFGFSDENNKENYRIFQINKDGNTKKTRTKMVFSVLFPSYDAMRVVKAYAFLDGRPYLLPVAWIWRALRSLFKGNSGKSLKVAAKPLEISDTQVEARIKVLKEWKLM